MPKTVIGPLSIPHIRMLCERLDEAEIPYDTFTTPTDLSDLRARDHQKEPRTLLTFSGLENIAYIELDTEHLQVIKPELEKLAYAFEESDGSEQQAEYLCPECDYVSKSRGLCPRHQRILLEFAEWARARKNRPIAKQIQMILWIIMAVILALIARRYF